MRIILDRTDLSKSFSSMVDPDLRAQTRLDASTEHRDLRRTLEGARVPIIEECAMGEQGCSYYVVKAERVGGADVDLFGVCFTNAAGRAGLIERGLLAPTEKPHAVLGKARAEAADRNSTTVRRQFAAFMQSSPDETDVAALPVTKLIGRPSLMQ